MWAHVARIRPAAENVSPPGDHFRRTALPRLQQTPGFAAAFMLRGRTERLGATVTYWDDEQSLKAALPELDRGRQEAAQSQGFEVLETDSYEIVVLDRKSRPEVGQFVRSTEVQGDPSKRDATVRAIEERIVPLVQTLPGYVSLVSMGNPETGHALTTTTWATEGELDGSADAVRGPREESVGEVGGTVRRVEEWRIVLAELRG